MKKADVLKAIEEGTEVYVDTPWCRSSAHVILGEGEVVKKRWGLSDKRIKGWRVRGVGKAGDGKERVVTSRRIVSTWADHLAEEKAEIERRDKKRDAAEARLAAAHVLGRRVVRVLGDAGVVVEPGCLMRFETTFLVSKQVVGDDTVVLHVTQADLLKLLDHLEGK